MVYLNYFSNIHIVSIFGNKKRTFTFSNYFNGKSEVSDASKSDKEGTTLTFTGFLGERIRSYDDLKPSTLKPKLIEQFLPLFYEKKKKKKHFKVNIELDTQEANKQKNFFSDSELITVDDIPNFECKTFKDNSIHAFYGVSISYNLRKGWGENSELTAACIDGRTIPINLIPPNAIPINHSAIFLFESELFTGSSDSSRQRLVLPSNVSETVLYRSLRREISIILNDNFPEIEKKNTRTKQQFEKKYPHLIGLFEEDTVGIIDKDEAIEIAQRRFFKQQKEILENSSLDDTTFQKSLEISSRTLTEYILYRELIIERLRKMDAENKEADIHNLIVPRYCQFHEENLIDGIYNNNAWLLDDKFMSFRTILSEVKMQEVIRAITLKEDNIKDDGRPDISMIFSADPSQVEKVDVVVVELKRRRNDDKENSYAATQLVKRARKLVDHCPTIQRIWYFAIIEIDEDLSQLLEDLTWTPLFSRGKVFYNDFQVKREDGTAVPTPTYLLSYDAVIKDAAARNHTFLEILKSDFKRRYADRQSS